MNKLTPQQRYYLKNKELVKERSKKWRLENPERNKELIKARREKDPEKFKMYRKKYYLKKVENERMLHLQEEKRKQ